MRGTGLRRYTFPMCNDPVRLAALRRPLIPGHPLVAGKPFVRFYAAARLAVDGQTLGTICAYDLKLHAVSVEQLGQVRTLATAAVSAIRQRPVLQ